MTGSELIEEFLHAQGVRRVYEVSGGMIALILDAIHRRDRIKLISVKHEQAAAFAAEADARCTGVPAVALATSGPGAINLLTGIGSCYFDSTPAVFITGQVNRHEQRGERPIRQLGFQETDIVAMARPITKESIAVTSPDDLLRLLEHAFSVALSGRPGPVLLDIPLDIQSAELSPPPARRVSPSAAAAVPRERVEEVLNALAGAERPLLLAGNGVRLAGMADGVIELAEALGTPVVTSLLGLDVLEYDHPLRVGMIGTYGNRWANLAVGRSDALLVLGSRLDVRQTGADAAFVGDGRRVHQVDVDRGELGQRVRASTETAADLRSFVPAALELLGDSRLARPDWLAEIRALREHSPDTAELAGIDGINPNALMHELSRFSTGAAAFVSDTGQHQMWAAQSLELQHGQRWLTTGGMGAMGSGLPLGLGAAFASEGRPVVVITGDGGLQANLQELETVAHHRLPIKLVILDNGAHGMVRQFQESYFESRYPSTVWGYSAPDFLRVAAAFGIDGCGAAQTAEVGAALERLWRDPSEPFVLHVQIDVRANVYPKIAFGRPLTEMEPLASPVPIGGGAEGA